MSNVYVKNTPYGIKIIAQSNGGKECPFAINLQNNSDISVTTNSIVTFSNVVYPAPSSPSDDCKPFGLLPDDNQLEPVTAVVIKKAGSYNAVFKGKVVLPLEPNGDLKVALAINGVVFTQSISTFDAFSGEVLVSASLLNLSVGDQVTVVNAGSGELLFSAIPNIPNASLTITKIVNV